MGSEAQAKRDRKRAIELMVKRLPRIELELHRYWELWHWHMQYVWLAIGEQMKQKAANHIGYAPRDSNDELSCQAAIRYGTGIRGRRCRLESIKRSSAGSRQDSIREWSNQIYPATGLDFFLSNGLTRCGHYAYFLHCMRARAHWIYECIDCESTWTFDDGMCSLVIGSAIYLDGIRWTSK